VYLAKKQPQPDGRKYAIQLQKEYQHRRKKQRTKAAKEMNGGPKKGAEANEI
jgi:hypothetical protein